MALLVLIIGLEPSNQPTFIYKGASMKLYGTLDMENFSYTKKDVFGKEVIKELQTPPMTDKTVLQTERSNAPAMPGSSWPPKVDNAGRLI